MSLFAIVKDHRKATSKILGLTIRFGRKDHASGNNKMCALERISGDLVGVLQDYDDCKSHQNQLGEMDATLATPGIDFVRALHRSSCFVNLSNHRLRLIMKAKDALRSMVDIRKGFPEECDKLYAEAVAELLAENATVIAGKRRKKALSKAGAKKGCEAKSNTREESDHASRVHSRVLRTSRGRVWLRRINYYLRG